MSCFLPYNDCMEQEKKIGSVAEEIEHLKRRITELEGIPSGKEKEEIIKEAVKEHAGKIPEAFLSENHRMAQEKIKEHAEKINNIESEKQHEEQIRELIQIAHDKGILNAVSIAKQLDPHFEDDFHKALVNYMQSVHNV